MLCVCVCVCGCAVVSEVLVNSLIWAPVLYFGRSLELGACGLQTRGQEADAYPMSNISFYIPFC